MNTTPNASAEVLASLMPVRRERVYDLVRAVGMDVADWANYKKGATAPAANPRYCYEWCFTQGHEHVVLNLWHASFTPRGDGLACDLNMRAYANEIARAGDEPWRDKKPKPVWEKRARSMDLAIQLAVRKNLPVRVIVCEGNMRDIAAGDEKASEVKRRMLDPEPWIIEAYDLNSGQTVLRRGLAVVPDVLDGTSQAGPSETPNLSAKVAEMDSAPPPEPEYTDQFDEEAAAPPERRNTLGSAFVRNPDVRAAALRRSLGLCQLCGQPGFVTVTGKVYLETHHVTPLGEGGPDVLANVVALCATDHRRAHFATQRSALRDELRAIAEGRLSVAQP